MPTKPSNGTKRTEKEIRRDIVDKRTAAKNWQDLATKELSYASADGKTIESTGQPIADAILAFAARLGELCCWFELIQHELSIIADDIATPRRRRRDTEE